MPKATPTSKPPPTDPVSAEEEDWSREDCGWLAWEPGRQMLRALRRYQALKARNSLLGNALSKVCVLQHRFWSAVAGSDVPLNSNLAGGLHMPHPNGVVVHPASHVGPNCLLMQQTTLGEGPKPGTPHLEGHVDVMAGAKVLGGVRIGAHAVIGANAVVIDDVPAGATVVGVPARRVDAPSMADRPSIAAWADAVDRSQGPRPQRRRASN